MQSEYAVFMCYLQQSYEPIRPFRTYLIKFLDLFLLFKLIRPLYLHLKTSIQMHLLQLEKKDQVRLYILFVSEQLQMSSCQEIKFILPV